MLMFGGHARNYILKRISYKASGPNLVLGNYHFDLTG